MQLYFLFCLMVVTLAAGGLPFFFLIVYLFIFIERAREGEGERGKHPCVRETSIGYLPHIPNFGLGAQHRHNQTGDLQAGAQPTEPHQPGCCRWISEGGRPWSHSHGTVCTSYYAALSCFCSQDQRAHSFNILIKYLSSTLGLAHLFSLSIITQVISLMAHSINC